MTPSKVTPCRGSPPPSQGDSGTYRGLLCSTYCYVKRSRLFTYLFTVSVLQLERKSKSPNSILCTTYTSVFSALARCLVSKFPFPSLALNVSLLQVLPSPFFPRAASQPHSGEEQSPGTRGARVWIRTCYFPVVPF